jgi:hypothetical protein
MLEPLHSECAYSVCNQASSLQRCAAAAALQRLPAAAANERTCQTFHLQSHEKVEAICYHNSQAAPGELARSVLRSIPGNTSDITASLPQDRLHQSDKLDNQVRQTRLAASNHDHPLAPRRYDTVFNKCRVRSRK